ncbi:MAG: glycosyltransferase family 4 protein [Chloroflexota bacterium]
MPPSLRRARLVLADSENTRNDLVCLLDARPDAVQVLYSGVEKRFAPLDDAAALRAVRDRLDLTRPFILFVGTIERRKNLTRLIRAYGRVRARRRDLPQLVIAGRRGWLYEDVFQAVAELGLDEDVRFLGHVNDADLPALYNLAELFVYPSLYEGFGLPPLEAMACGTPVVSSNTSSLPEVLGDAAIGVAPTDTDGLAIAIEGLLDDATLRAELRERGLAQAARFTWEAAATQLLEVYRRAAV